MMAPLKHALLVYSSAPWAGLSCLSERLFPPPPWGDDYNPQTERDENEARVLVYEALSYWSVKPYATSV
jgi:hypothetical protein